jgi:hypothetical protein
MAKKVKQKVIVYQEYLDILIDKAEMLDDLFDSEGGRIVSIAESDFKDYDKVCKAFEKVDSVVEILPQDG